MEIFLIEENNQVRKLINILQKKNKLPNLSNAITITAPKVLQREWSEEIQKSSTKQGWKKYYIDAININVKDNFNSEVSVDENNKFVNFVEDGIKRFDMIPGLINGPRSKISKEGNRYNIIFMRKGIPGTQHIPNMPEAIYKKIKKVAITQKSKREDSKYKAVLTGLRGSKKKRTKGKASIYEGLTKIGSKGQSKYGTFRVVTKNSTGWIYPGVPPTKIFNTVKRKIKPKIEKILKEGLVLDIQAGLEYLSKK